MTEQLISESLNSWDVSLTYSPINDVLCHQCLEDHFYIPPHAVGLKRKIGTQMEDERIMPHAQTWIKNFCRIL